MKLLAKLFLVLCCILLPAWSAVVTITIDETTQNYTARAGISFNSGVLVLCQAFDAGAAAVCSGSNVSDVVTFSGGNLIQYFSEREAGDPAPAGAETGIPSPLPNFGVGQRFVLEGSNENIELVTYNPTANDPGGSLVAGDSYTYRIFSDTPEPATMLLMGAGLLAIGFGRRLIRS
jgi:hypothetical protein